MNQLIQSTHLVFNTFVLGTNLLPFVAIPFCLSHFSLSFLATLLTPHPLIHKISYQIHLFLLHQSLPSSSIMAFTTLPLSPMNSRNSPSPLPLLSGQNPLLTPPSLSLLLPLLCPAKLPGTNTTLPLPAGADSVHCFLLSPTLDIY
jgi:hypothetical protein